VKVIDATFVTSAPNVGALPPATLPEAAVVGRSNVGKSSLLATLLGRKKLVRVSRRPGCTQMINLFTVATDEGPLSLVDLPGYGYAEAPVEERRRWGPMIGGYLRDRASLCLVVVLVDPRRRIGDEERGLFEMLGSVGRPMIIVATKMDKIQKAKRKPTLAALEEETGCGVIPFSAKTGEGVDRLWLLIGRACGIG
jgi:GTP-binding protein